MLAASPAEHLAAGEIQEAKPTFSAEQNIKAQKTLATFKKPANWIVVFGVALAVCAGIVDAVGFHLFNIFVTNQTGNTARLGLEIREIHLDSNEAVKFKDAGIVLVCFMGGAFLCGLLIDKNQVHFGGKSAYGLALIGNALLLCFATYAACPSQPVEIPRICGAYFAAAASGLQNAMCTSHFGAVVRTTHITGTVTDIGSTSGRMMMILLKKKFRISNLNVVERAEIQVDMRKLLVLLPIALGFGMGCLAGAYLEVSLHQFALLLPAGFTGVVGFVYMFFRNRLKEKIKRAEIKRLAKDLQDMDGALVRAHSCLAELRQYHHTNLGVDEGSDDSSENRAVVSLDEEVERALGVVHSLEMTLDELRSEQSYRDRVSPKTQERALRVVHSQEMTLDELKSEQSYRDRVSPKHQDMYV